MEKQTKGRMPLLIYGARQVGKILSSKNCAGRNSYHFDEIQMCERALTSFKYFAEEAPEYHVMVAGSLLRVAVNREKYSFPVGKVQMLAMYPMDLEEVLWAKGKQILSDTIREHYNSNVPLEDALHEEAMQEFEQMHEVHTGILYSCCISGFKCI